MFGLENNKFSICFIFFLQETFVLFGTIPNTLFSCSSPRQKHYLIDVRDVISDNLLKCLIKYYLLNVEKLMYFKLKTSFVRSNIRACVYDLLKKILIHLMYDVMDHLKVKTNCFRFLFTNIQGVSTINTTAGYVKCI